MTNRDSDGLRLFFKPVRAEADEADTGTSAGGAGGGAGSGAGSGSGTSSPTG